MRLNLAKRTERRLPQRVMQSLEGFPEPNRRWSMDSVSDRPVSGPSSRTLNVVNEGAREALAIKVDPSLPAERVIRVLAQIKNSRPLPTQIRADNGPELISSKLVEWSEKNGFRLQYFQQWASFRLPRHLIALRSMAFRRESLTFGAASGERVCHLWSLDSCLVSRVRKGEVTSDLMS
jgi:transposase InsO family protein